jgi:hypothetical protein
MTETLFVLFLTMGGGPIEWTPHFTLSNCLGVKRKIERNIGKKAGSRYSCKKDTVVLEKSSTSDEYYIVEFVEN